MRIMCLIAGLGLWLQAGVAAACPALLDHSFRSLAGESRQKLCQDYADRVLLVVNTASYCGYTPQYEGLVSLYRDYRERGLVVLGFPSNDFAQEPGAEGEIKDFCELTYGVEFPMFEKLHVRGGEAHPFYRALTEISGSAPGWNFHKYLISRDGEQVLSFPTRTEPTDPALISAIEQLL